jgi:hypothetical protein
VLQAQDQGWFGRVSIVIDAQRRELYLASYELSAHECKLADPLHLIAVDTLPSEAANTILIGPEATRWADHGRILFPEAGTLGRLFRADECQPPEKLEPIYLRAPSFVKAPPPRILL